MLNLNLLFYFFSTLLVFSAVMVVISQHAVFSLLFLVSSFILSAFLLLLLECEFLALLFIVIYVGAIAILFLFSIMMLESKLINLTKNTIKYFPVGIVFSVCLLPLLNLINNHFSESPIYYNNIYLNKYQNWYDLIDSTYDINVYGQVLYSYFVLQFLIAGLILLLILIGVVYLTNSFEKHTIQQSSFRQLSRNAKIF
jgi:NADH-quinone oxidoreductase subunit J